MTSTEPYSVKFAPGAARRYERLPADVRRRVRKSLEKLARDVTTPGRVGGKTVKTIRGARDSFHRLRVGDYGVLFDVIEHDRVELVLGIVHSRDLEQRLRNR